MVKTYSGTSEETVYVCHACGNGFTSLESTGECPECGGSLADTNLTHNYRGNRFFHRAGALATDRYSRKLTGHAVERLPR